MASVFLSYDREDADRAKRLALALDKAGHSVWWDRHIKGGAQYSKEIEKALNSADAVVVMWSERSVESAWVRDEAAAGRDTGRLVPVLIDAIQPPLGFRQYQAIDLSRWTGRGPIPNEEGLEASLRALTSSEPANGRNDVVVVAPAARKFLFKRAAAAMAALLALAGATIFLIRDRQSAGIQNIAVVAAHPGAKTLARDLLVNLGTLSWAKAGSMSLVGSNAKGADLIFEVASDTHPSARGANLMLMAGKDRSVLWSGEIEQKAGDPANVKQQTGLIAARVLSCALDGISPKYARLRKAALTLYLNACAQLDDSHWADLSKVIAILEGVTEEAPSFEPAWSKLLAAQTNQYQIMTSAEQRMAAAGLRRTIASARRANAEIPEAYVAEIELLPGRRFSDQVRLIDQAAKADPDNPFVLANRSIVMLSVGRVAESVQSARKASRLDPLSPSMRSYYIQGLIYADQAESARFELAQAEKLWPGADTILNARYRLSLHHGNLLEAADALQLIKTGSVEGSSARQAFLRARLSPTPENIVGAVRAAKAASEHRPDSDTAADVIFSLGEFDRTEEVLAFLLSWKDTGQIPYLVDILFRPPLADLRADPRFMHVAARWGLVAYWRESGRWPDFCSEPDLPYDCQAEAAKWTRNAT